MTENIKRTAISISIYGETAVGKTCICSVFLGLEFQEDHLTTVGMEKISAEVELNNGEKIKLKLWDTAGEERFRSISFNSLKSSHGCIIVFDLSNKKSFDRVTNWLTEIREQSSKIPIVLFGNKCDIDPKEVKQEEIEELCQKEGMIYFETSAKLNKGIQEGINKICELAYEHCKKEDIRRGEQLKAVDNKTEKKKRYFC
jgi:small GTP-binding protein